MFWYEYPIITIGEFLNGFQDYSLGLKIWKEIEELLEIKTIFITNKTLQFYHHLFWKLKEEKKKITQNDLWILALNFENNLLLLSLDKKLKENFEFLQKKDL